MIFYQLLFISKSKSVIINENVGFYYFMYKGLKSFVQGKYGLLEGQISRTQKTKIINIKRKEGKNIILLDKQGRKLNILMN